VLQQLLPGVWQLGRPQVNAPLDKKMELLFYRWGPHVQK
jgi:hypothetical protein